MPITVRKSLVYASRRCGLVLVFGLAFMAPLDHAQAAGNNHTDRVSRPIIWMINAGALKQLRNQGAWPLVRQTFDHRRNFILVGRRPPAWLHDWTTQMAHTATQVGDVEAIVTRSRDPIQAVVFDRESWRFTPIEQQEHPRASIAAAATATHRHGLRLIAAPAADLMRRLAPGVPRYEAYLAYGMAKAAYDADVFEIQAQGSETNLRLYRSFVTRAAQQARAANPKVIVLAGLSTNPVGHRVSADQLLRDVQATRNVVDGYWLNIPAGGPYCPNCGTPQPGVAAGLLQMLQQPGS
ncbi:MAG: hypothetical protein ACYDGU_14190 [Acidiferrobacterales bacterium]